MKFRAIFIALTLISFVTNVIATQYQTNDFGVGKANDINDNGQVVGQISLGWSYRYWVGDTHFTYQDAHAFVWDKSNGMQYLPPVSGSTYGPTSVPYEGNSINNSGTVACFGENLSGYPWRYSLWNQNNGYSVSTVYVDSIWDINDLNEYVGSTAYTPPGNYDYSLLIPGASMNGSIILTGTQLSGSSYAYEINNLHQVVGTYGGNSAGAFYWSSATGTIDIPGASEARAINEHSQVVGKAGNHAFLWDNANGICDIGALFGFTNTSSAYDINNFGQVVGEANGHAYVWDSVHGFQYLDNNSSVAYGINELGQIVGQSNGQAVLWQPVPEPSSILALVSGFIGLAGLRQRKRQA